MFCKLKWKRGTSLRTPFLTSALGGGEWLASCPGRIIERESASSTR